MYSCYRNDALKLRCEYQDIYKKGVFLQSIYLIEFNTMTDFSRVENSSMGLQNNIQNNIQNLVVSYSFSYTYCFMFSV